MMTFQGLLLRVHKRRMPQGSISFEQFIIIEIFEVERERWWGCGRDKE